MMTALEPRVMFDASVGALVPDAAHADTAAAAHQPPAAEPPRDTPNAPPVANVEPAPPPAGAPAVVFIDGQVQNHQQLLNSLPAGTDVVVLDAGRDGFAQMAQYLSGRHDLGAISLLSHGHEGAVQAGSAWLTSDTLQAHAADLGAIGQALAPGGDLLLYGCRIGAGTEGQALLDGVAALTGADVAASTDNTGAAQLGGDWVLERQVGAIDGNALPGASTFASYQALLAVPADENYDTNSGASFTADTFTLDGIKYTIVGSNPGNYTNIVSNNSAMSLLGNNAGDYFMFFDLAGAFGISSIKVEAADSSAFRLSNLSFDAAADVNITITPNGGTALTYSSNGALILQQNINTSGITAFQNITSFTIAGGNLSLALDDLDFEPAVSPNSAPVVANLNGDSVGFTEGGSAVLIDSGSNATVTDGDSADFSGGNVTASITANRVSGEDVLSIRNQGTGGGQIGVSGSNVTYAGVTIGTYTGGTGTSDLVVTLNANANATATQALLRNLTYSNSNGADPSTTARTVRVTVNDGDGGTSTNANVTVGLTSVNDAPTLTATGGTPTYTENGSAVDLFSGVSISTVEAGQAIDQITLTVSNLADGASEILRIDGTDVALTQGNSLTTSTNSMAVSVSVTSGTATVTVGKVAGISAATAQTLVDGLSYRNASDAPGTTSRVVTLTGLRDTGGTSNGGVDSTSLSVAATVAVAAVNDAPTLSGGPHALPGTNEDTPSSGTLVSTVLAGLTFGDVDTGALSGIAITARTGNGTWQYSTDGTTWNGVGTVSGASALLLSSSSQLRYVPDAQNGETATLTFRAWDQTSGSASTNSTRSTADSTTNGGTTAFSTGTAQASLVVSAVNDAPVLVTSGGSASFTEGNNTTSTPVAIDSGLTLSDVDSGTLASATVSITGNFTTGQDVLSFTNNPATMGNVAASYDSATGVLTLTSAGSSATLAQWQAALRSVTYTNSAESPATATRTLSFEVNDGSTSSTAATRTVTVASVNDAPIGTASGGTTAFTEGNNIVSTPVVVDAGFTVSDADNGTLASATVSITGNFTAGQDILAFTNDGSTMGNVAASYDSSTGVLTLSSAGASTTVAQWQAALRAVTYTNSAESPATGTRTISFVANDGTADSAASTRAVSVASINDTPVNTVPATQSLGQDLTLVFSSGNGNAISLADADAGGGVVRVTLTATNGLLTLSGTTGLTFTVGSGSGDATMTFEGTLADINAGLNGLSFTPTSAYLGAASLQVVSNDLGLTGTGGAQTDTDTVTINVVPLNPLVTVVSATTPDGTYTVGTTITTTVSFDQAVTVDTSGGTPTLLLETGSVDRIATYVSGSGTSTLTFSYTVQVGDASADLDYASSAALALNGATLRGSNNLDAVLTLPTTGSANSLAGQRGLVIDAVAPVVAGVSVPANGSYVAGQNLDFTVNFSESVVIDTTGGTPRIAVTLDTGGTVYANYVSGSGTSALVFRLPVAAGQLDGNGIALGATIDPHGGTLLDTVGNVADPALHSVGSTSGVLIDAVSPAVASVAVPATGLYNAGDVLTFTVNTSEAVTVDTTGGTPRLALDIGGVTVFASHVSGSGGSALVFQYTVQPADADADGIAVGNLSPNGATLRDAAGNDLATALNGVGSTAGVRVDNDAPVASAIALAGTSPTNAATVSYTVTFNEDVSGVDAGDFSLVATGSASGSITSVVQVDARTYTVTVAGTAGTGALRLDLNPAATGIVDAAGNALGGGLAGAAYSIDRNAPVAGSVGVPANGTYITGQNLDFTVNFNEAVLVDTAGGTPRIAVTLDNGSVAYATYQAGSGSTTLTFRLTLEPGLSDADGVTLASSIDTQGGTLRDTLGNDAVTTLAGIPSTAGVHVDAITPTIAAVALPADGQYAAGAVLTFTVGTSEAVTVDTSGGTPRLALDIGGNTVFATYVSGSGSMALVFQYTVQAGDNRGLSVTGLQANGGSLRDAAGNALSSTLNGVPTPGGVVIDTAAPTVVGITPLGTSPTSASEVGYRVAFSEDVTGLDLADFSLVKFGQADGTVLSVTQVDARTYTVVVGQLSGTGEIALRLNGPGSGISDAVGNLLDASTQGGAYQLVASPPVPVAADPPAPPAPVEPVLPPQTWIAPITFNGGTPLNRADTPTLDAVPPLVGITPTPTVTALAPLLPDALATPGTSVALGPRSDARTGFIEIGATDSVGLKAIPDIGDFSVRAGQPLSISLPASTFTHSDRGERLTVEVRLANGRPLPAWLKFDPITGTLSGQPPAGLNQRLDIEVIARDSKGNRASSQIEVDVRSTAPARSQSGLPQPELPSLDTALPLQAVDVDVADEPPTGPHTGRPGLAAQFDQHGAAARHAERTALLDHLRAAARQA